MSISISVPPIGLSAIPPLAFQLLTTGTSALAASTFDSASSIVDLSGDGLLLSAVSAARDRLIALQATPADNTQAGLLASAQGFVDVFNRLQSKVASLQTLFNGVSGNLPVDQFSLALNQLAAEAITADSAALDRLQRIGIGVIQSTSSALSLGIDQDALSAAIASDPAGTRELLEQAAPSVLAQLAAFEKQAVSASVNTSIAQADLTTLTRTAIPAADLNQQAEQNTGTGTTLQSTATARLPTAGAAKPRTTPTAELVPTAVAGQAVPVNNTLTATTRIASATAIRANTETLAAERQASLATLTLQNLLSDPANLALKNLVDPAYSALIAASHLSDFVLPTAATDPKKLLADIPAQVLPVARIRALEPNV